MTVVNTETGEIIELVSVEHANRWAERARLDLEASADRGAAGMNKIRQAIAERHDASLGFRSIGDYVSQKYGDALTQVCRVFGADFRREVVSELAAAGMSTRSIAPVVGVSHMTVQNDVTSGVKTFTPEPERKTVEEILDNADELAKRFEDYEPKPEDERPVVVGIDGKRYPQKAPRVIPRPAAEKTLYSVETLAAKAARESLTLTPEQIRRVRAEGRDLTALRQSIEALHRLLDALTPEEQK